MKDIFLFPGQGAQYAGMGRDLYEASDSVKELVQMASDTTGMDVKRLIFEATDEELKETVNTQITITLVNLAAAQVLKEKGFQPAGCAGFSLGEYAALVTAGVLAPQEVFPLVKKRGELMAAACATLDRSAGDPGMAAVIGLSPEAVDEFLQNSAIPQLFGANYNSPTQVVISGTAAALAAAQEPLKAAGARRIITLKVSGPFHSPLLKGAADQLATYLEGLHFNDPTLELFSNVTGKAIETGAQAKELAVRQVIAPVRWTWEEATIVQAGYTRALEAGPGAVLTGLWQAFGTTIPIFGAGKLELIEKIV